LAPKSGTSPHHDNPALQLPYQQLGNTALINIAIVIKDSSIPTFYEAVRLIAVTQASSAAAERVFSQLTFIRRAVGDATLKDMMELRSFIRCNNGYVNDFRVAS